MNTRQLSASLAAFLAASLTAEADPVTSTFNYQGRLNHNNAPANGTFDLKFDLFAVESGGNPVVPGIERLAQNIRGGLVSADLNFGGTAVFDGTAYWLAISARPAGAANYVPADRKPVRPTPYSIYSMSAAAVKDGAVTSSSLAAGAVTGAKLASGAVGFGQLNAAGAPASGQVLAYNGAGLSWITPPGGGGGSGPWLLSGTNAYYNAGRVGIGTSTPSHILSIAGVSPAWTSFSWLGAIELPNAAAIGWQTNTSGKRFGMGHTNGGFFIFRTDSDPGTMTAPPVYDFGVNDAGNIQIPGGVNIGGAASGGSLPQSAKLEIQGQNAIRIDGYQPVITMDDTNTDFLLGSGVRIQCVDGQMVFQLQSNFNGTTWPYVTKAVLDRTGMTFDGLASVKSLTIRGGADLAEPFAMSQPGAEPGSVVVIDADHPGKLKVSTSAYDRKVAGIVSGANGIQPGISMIQEDKLETGENVALSGRVYVKADTSAGPIEPGDLLTTSSNAGRAMKAAHHEKAQGAIIGKAMTGLRDGDGMVLVLVSLQ